MTDAMEIAVALAKIAQAITRLAEAHNAISEEASRATIVFEKLIRMIEEKG